MPKNAVFTTNPMRPLAGQTLTRKDDIDLTIYWNEPGQTGATLKFTAMLAEEYPNGTPSISIVIPAADITVTGNSLSATASIASLDTAFVINRYEFVFDIERNIGGKKKTLEFGKFIVEPDVTP